MSNNRKNSTPMIRPPMAHLIQLPPNRRPTATVISAVAMTNPSHWNRNA
ncbi:Uncharacterised protein [Bordetella pertussis]|nr:Uncharacterised protein [Bordetella pertussis]